MKRLKGLRLKGGRLPLLGPSSRHLCPALLTCFALAAGAQEGSPVETERSVEERDLDENDGSDAPAASEPSEGEDSPSQESPPHSESTTDADPPPASSDSVNEKGETAPLSDAAPGEAVQEGTDENREIPSESSEPDSTPTDDASERIEGVQTLETDSPEPIEVTVVGRRVASGVDRSSRAVTVIDLERARVESSDLGEVISREEGVNVQRVGGLGSETRFSLAGFDDNQIRFFIDGVPIEFAGYPFGMQNVPVNFATRVETFKGVVPVYLGADAIGGAFNLITDRATKGTQAFASYSMGSFGLLRLSASGRHLHGPTGFFTKVEGFYDKSDNDYPIYVDVADRTGVITETKVHRFHDAYQSGGGNVEVGWVDRPWAKRLLLRGFATSYRKELQHNSIMTVPYGEVEEGATSMGASLRYEDTFKGDVTARAVGGYVHDRLGFLDESECIYNWFGQCANSQVTPGELGLDPSDNQLREHTGYLRSSVDFRPHMDHMLRFSTAPTYQTRTGDDRYEEVNDPLNAKRKMFKWVNGLEYEAHPLAGRVVNSVFVKNYFQTASSEETFQENVTLLQTERFLWGFGDGLRVDLLESLFAKASYEYATRLPDLREVFGNGGFILENLDLAPERSHNINLTLALDNLATPIGTLAGNTTGFFRDPDNLIVLFPTGDSLRYENVYSARVWGIEGALTWVSPGDYVEVGVNATFQELRNTSSEGALALYKGDRIPNKPYLGGNSWVRLQKGSVAAPGDLISLTWRTRYTHEYYRNWEGAGRKGPEDSVPTQLTQGLVLSYLTSPEHFPQLTFSAEMQNLTDERVYDFLGVQRPGRASFFKVTTTL